MCPTNAESTNDAIGSAARAKSAGNAILAISFPISSALKTLLRQQRTRISSTWRIQFLREQIAHPETAKSWNSKHNWSCNDEVPTSHRKFSKSPLSGCLSLIIRDSSLSQWELKDKATVDFKLWGILSEVAIIFNSFRCAGKFSGRLLISWSKSTCLWHTFTCCQNFSSAQELT